MANQTIKHVVMDTKTGSLAHARSGKGYLMGKRDAERQAADASKTYGRQFVPCSVTPLIEIEEAVA